MEISATLPVKPGIGATLYTLHTLHTCILVCLPAYTQDQPDFIARHPHLAGDLYICHAARSHRTNYLIAFQRSR